MVGFGDSTTVQCPTKKPELNPTLTVWFTNDVTKISQKILIATLGFEGGNTKGKGSRSFQKTFFVLEGRKYNTIEILDLLLFEMVKNKASR